MKYEKSQISSAFFTFVCTYPCVPVVSPMLLYMRPRVHFYLSSVGAFTHNKENLVTLGGVMKNLKFYFKKGAALTKMAMKGKSFFTKMLLGLYLILSFFGKIFFITRPIFMIADNNLAMMIVEGHDFELNKLFEGINSKKRYSSVLLSTLFIEGIVFIAAIVLVVPYVVWEFIPAFYNTTVPPFIFAIVFGVAVLVLSLGLGLTYSPLGFIAAKGTDLNVGDMLFLSKEGSANAKGKVFMLHFVYYLIMFLVLAVLFFGAYMVTQYVTDGYGYPAIYANFIVLGIFIAYAFIDIFVLALCRLNLLISLYSIFFDNVEAKHIVVARRGAKGDEFTPLFTDDKEKN